MNATTNSTERQNDAISPLRIFIVVGEHSGDALGAKLMSSLNALLDGRALYKGVGGEHMEAEGFTSLFPLEDVAVMGPMSILPRLPTIIRRINQTVDAAIAENPDIVVIIDSPEFTHPIAKRIRKKAPNIPIVDYVSPSIWAWRSGRARKMKPYVDHVLALLPFEPEAHRKYGGPPCTYVGHSLSERADWITSRDTTEFRDRLNLAQDKPILTVLPGSRTSEVKRLMEPFGKTLSLLLARGRTFSVVVPTVKYLRPLIEEHAASWPVKPILVDGEDNKFCAFRASRAALAASGTVTLELAIAGTPMVVAYRVDPVAARLRFLLQAHSVVLANLVLGENAFPEYLQEDCKPELLADALDQLLQDTPQRAAQIKALEKIPGRMAYEGTSPSAHAAKIVLEHARRS